MNGFQQACAIPFRRKGKRIEFCLITSSSGRWVFPKGLIDPGDTPIQTARKEALEEAGLHGRVLTDPVGTFKARKNGRMLAVIALLMEVTRSDQLWLEADRRQRCWVGRGVARRLISQPELHACLKSALKRLR